MNLGRLFSKPRWQSKDADVRRDAVARDDDVELRAALPQLAKDDPDAGVRLAALKRLAEPALAQSLASDDRDEGVRKAAAALWTDLLTGTHAQSPSLTERLRLLRGQDDAKLIEHIAVRAPEADLRLAALARVMRPALIFERATTDADAEVRTAALSRIDDEAQLARIVERTRKTDKRISREAGERIERLRLARGDAATVREHARRLCERLEAALRNGDSSAVAPVVEAWQAIAQPIEAELRTRFEAARELHALSSDPVRVAALRERARERERIANEVAALEHALTLPSAHADLSALEQRFNMLAMRFAEGAAQDVDGPQIVDARRVHAIATRLHQLAMQPAPGKPSTTPDVDAEAAERRRRETAEAQRRQRERREADLARLDACLGAVEAALATGHSADAHRAWNELAEQRRTLEGALPAALQSRYVDAEAAHAKLEQWQRWGDNQRRQQLCDEIATLSTSGMHPDAIATRVKEAQAEWTRLDELEGRPAQVVDGLARRFRALCRAAIEPVRPYFDKRDELRKAHAAKVDDLLARIGLADGDDTPVGALLPLRRAAADALRNLDRVDPRSRKALAQKLKDALARIDNRIDASNAGVQAAKAALIERAEALAALDDVRSAMNAARDLQKRWQAAGNGRRSRDEAQWKAFRGAIDRVFARADDERAQREAQDTATRETAARLCTELETLAAAPEPPPRGEVARIDAAWLALGIGDQALRRRHEAAHAALRDAAERRRRGERRARFDAWLTHYEVLRAGERGERDAATTMEALAALPALDIATAAMQARADALAGAAVATASDMAEHRDALIELERFAGVDSPAEDRQRRMDLQVSQLSARLRGERAQAPAQQLEALLMRWTETGAFPAQHADFDTRLVRALRHALEML
ncbi:MAG TPA: DUF349 domain-containing protein [Dokdonella sp.]|uniref:DUF349 domain-containing protein n=1 Tax=Dokdonella sp. TaxID=2291710 RepID=UPI0025C34D0D|nr:DUF349 domain-containing protein [Dokdonella sp.]MBX3693043.1 DUF349 domain-containing protein [Dokdonella sp.]HNR92066.1 DUF349 domain-containing protein [Dokdonella sp.]